MALKWSLAKAGGVLENITSEFHKRGEFVSKSDWRDGKRVGKENRLNKFNENSLLTQTPW
jgi:hypothetical protein